MSTEKYSIGGTVQETDASEAFADIPQNRVLLAEQLTADPPVKPVIVEGLTNIDQVFEQFKPKVDMEFETEEGTMAKESLHFKNLGHFGVKGITAQSKFLTGLEVKKENYQKITRQLKTNKLMKQAMTNADSKESLLAMLQALVAELESAR